VLRPRQRAASPTTFGLSCTGNALIEDTPTTCCVPDNLGLSCTGNALIEDTPTTCCVPDNPSWLSDSVYVYRVYVYRVYVYSEGIAKGMSLIYILGAKSNSF
jgi:hypothetical protein